MSVSVCDYLFLNLLCVFLCASVANYFFNRVRVCPCASVANKSFNPER
jgi:hypothetical protein